MFKINTNSEIFYDINVINVAICIHLRFLNQNIYTDVKTILYTYLLIAEGFSS